LNPVEQARRSYAAELRFIARMRSSALVNAFATVPREQFVGPGPWRIKSPMDLAEYWTTDDDDPSQMYHDVLIALDESRGINNGQPSLWAYLRCSCQRLLIAKILQCSKLNLWGSLEKLLTGAATKIHSESPLTNRRVHKQHDSTWKAPVAELPSTRKVPSQPVKTPKEEGVTPPGGFELPKGILASATRLQSPSKRRRKSAHSTRVHCAHQVRVRDPARV